MAPSTPVAVEWLIRNNCEVGPDNWCISALSMEIPVRIIPAPDNQPRGFAVRTHFPDTYVHFVATSFLSRLAASVGLVMIMAAGLIAAGCSGGGGGGGSAIAAIGGKPPETSALTVTLTNAAGATTNSLTAGSPLTVKAALTDSKGSPVPNAVIAFAVGDATLASVTPTSALTDANGVAVTVLYAAGTSTAGASSVTATYVPAGGTAQGGASGSASFQVNAAAVDLALTVSPTSLSAYGTASVSATVSVNGAPPSTPVTVQFTSVCAANGLASLGQTPVPVSMTTVNGVAAATYTDKGCGQTDVLTASVGTIQKTATITVAAPTAVSIQFVSSTPSQLVIKGTGGFGYSETSQVKFKAVDVAGNGIANQTVRLGLTTNAGGITLDGMNVLVGSTISKLTGADGTVSVSVQSGTVPTSVWVTAALGSVATQSNQLIISTGRPSQNFFSLSAEILNMDGGNYDGAEGKLNIRAADRMGNTVPDGTTINFITEGAQIKSGTGQPGTTATCTTTSGACQVTMVSAEARPSDGRVTVLAYALGEESFSDLNGNNVYDAGETWDDLGNPCIDANENGVCDSSEQFIQYNAANNLSCPVSSSFNSSLLMSMPSSCNGAWGPAFVRNSMVITLSRNRAATNVASVGGSGCAFSGTITLTDGNNNPLPFGTTLSIPAELSAVQDSSATPKSATVSVFPTTVPNTNVRGGTQHMVTVKLDSCTAPLRGNFTLGASTPVSKVTSFINFRVN